MANALGLCRFASLIFIVSLNSHAWAQAPRFPAGLDCQKLTNDDSRSACLSQLEIDSMTFEFEAVDRRHPGWGRTVNTPEFKSWYQSQPQAVQALAKSPKAVDAIQMLDMYVSGKSQATQEARSLNAAALCYRAKYHGDALVRDASQSELQDRNIACDTSAPTEARDTSETRETTASASSSDGWDAFASILGALVGGAIEGYAAGQAATTTAPSYYTPPRPVASPARSYYTPTKPVATQVYRQEEQCGSDFACGPGRKCVKAPGGLFGVCLQSVDDYGTPTYSPPSSSSVLPRSYDSGCRFNTDCPIGFRCDQALKACVK